MMWTLLLCVASYLLGMLTMGLCVAAGRHREARRRAAQQTSLARVIREANENWQQQRAAKTKEATS